jgi:lipopolysaccharide export system permease protein
MLINKLIIKAVWQAFFMVMLAVMGVFFMVLLIGELGSIGHFHYTVTDALMYSFLLLPSQLYSLLPMLGFLAAILGLGRLSTQNELVAVRAAGFSRWQIIKAVVFAAIVLISIVTWVGESYAFKWANKAQSMKSIALNQSTTFSKQSHSWLKGKNSIMFIDSIKGATTASGVTLFKFDQKGVLSNVIHAPSMIKGEKGWVLPKATNTLMNGSKIQKKLLTNYQPHIDFKPSFVQGENEDPAGSSLKELWGIAYYRWQHHLASDQISFAFWLRLFQPINTVIMIWLGIPFVFGTLRHSTMGFRLLIGIVVGFSFYMLNQVIGPLCMLYQWPPTLAAVIPSLLLIILGVVLLRGRKV